MENIMDGQDCMITDGFWVVYGGLGQQIASFLCELLRRSSIFQRRVIPIPDREQIQVKYNIVICQ
jgi:hypothetical protein